MARKQTRRSISVSGPTYHRLKAYCESTDTPMSRVTEQLILAHLGDEPIPEPKPPEPQVSPADMDRPALMRFHIQREAERRREEEREAAARKAQLEAERLEAMKTGGGIFTF